MLYGCPFEKNEKEVFFRLTTFFFRNKIFFFHGTAFVQCFMYYYAKNNFGAIRKFLKIFIFENLLRKKGPKEGMLILSLLGMYFDAAVVFVKTFLLLFRFALAIL